MPPTPVHDYQRVLDELRSAGERPDLLKRMSELVSLLDLTTTLSAGLSDQEMLDAALLVVMGELQATRGCLLVRDEGESYLPRAARGLPRALPAQPIPLAWDGSSVVLRPSERHAELLESLGLEALCWITRAERPIAVLGLGPRASGRAYGAAEVGFLHSVAACAAAPIENGLVYRELVRVYRKLTLSVFQLRNLFEITRELTTALDEAGVRGLVLHTLMGQLMASRCGIYLPAAGGFVLADERGGGGEGLPRHLPEPAAAGFPLTRPLPVEEIAGGLGVMLRDARLALLVPLPVGSSCGFVAVGERQTKAPFSEEDLEFASTLAQQAGAALESARLHQVALEKLRQDRELQIAREIQRSLFPSARPSLPGFDLAADSIACREVGGDHYDFIPLPGGRIALAVADVAGKGTPASILMASVHAWLRALAGTTPPADLMLRLNRFLIESTQAERYVTLFYAELDPSRGVLGYVNAGHVPPFHLTRGGELRRLECGGPVVGLLDEACFAAAEVALAPGDLLAVVTDGVTESTGPDGAEFDTAGVVRTLEAARRGGAGDVLAALVGAARRWAEPEGCGDDLTALVLKVT